MHGKSETEGWIQQEQAGTFHIYVYEPWMGWIEKYGNQY